MNSGIEKRIRKLTEYRWFFPLVSCVLAFFFLLHLSLTCSPLAPNVYGYDSAFFQAIGKSWVREGILPFRDFFDHKGPLIFLISAVAWAFPWPRMVLFIIEWFFCTVTVFLAFAILKNKPLWFRFAAVFFMLFFWGGTFYEGNLTEEYSIPFVMLSMLFQLKWFERERHEDAHPVRYGFVYGLCFGVINMIVVKYALAICVLTFVISLELVFRRQWKNLVLNAAACLLGALIPFIPFAVYFAVKGAFRDFIFCSFVFSFRYLENTVNGGFFKGVAENFRFLTPELALIPVGAYHLFKKNYSLAGAAILTSLLQIYLCVYSARYLHYFMIGAPLVVLVFALFDRNLLIKSSWMMRICAVLSCLILTAGCVLLFPRIKGRCLPGDEDGAYANKVYTGQLREIFEAVPENERNQVAFYNLNDSENAIFLVNDGVPCINRYPVLTEQSGDIDPEIYSEVKQLLEETKPLWVIVSDESENEDILGIIRRDYEEYHSVTFAYRFMSFGNQDTLRLYRRKG